MSSFLHGRSSSKPSPPSRSPRNCSKPRKSNEARRQATFRIAGQWPIIFVHGSTHTGAALDSTPDGKEGWHSYAVRHNLASFVMDQPGRGRSGFDQSVLHEAKATGNWDMVPTFGRVTH